jgi:hypothetical protein
MFYLFQSAAEIALIVSVSVLSALVIALVAGLVVVKQKLEAIRYLDPAHSASPERYINMSDEDADTDTRHTPISRN